MKKVFKVIRKSDIDYDEFDSCVIIADDKSEVNRLIDSGNVKYWDMGKDDREIIEIDLQNSESMELVASFNAG